MERSKALQIYMKPGIREDDLMLRVWDACRKHDRPQDVFRTMLRAGLRAMYEGGELPDAVIEDCGLDGIFERRRGRTARRQPDGQQAPVPVQPMAPPSAPLHGHPPQPYYYPPQPYDPYNTRPGHEPSTPPAVHLPPPPHAHPVPAQSVPQPAPAPPAPAPVPQPHAPARQSQPARPAAPPRTTEDGEEGSGTAGRKRIGPLM